MSKQETINVKQLDLSNFLKNTIKKVIDKKIEEIKRDIPVVVSDSFNFLSFEKRKELIESFEGLGVKVENDKGGLAGLDKKRKENLAQFFTPLSVCKLAVDMLNISSKATVFDNSCGSGRFFWYLKNQKLATGIEKEDYAFKVLKQVFPESNLIQDDLINYVVDEKFDYFLGNPPFSLRLYDEKGLFVNTGYKGSVLSHLAAIESGVRSVKQNGYVAIVLPSNVWSLDSTRVFHKWLNEKTNLIAEIMLPKGVFEGTDWETSLFIYHRTNYCGRKDVPAFVAKASSVDSFSVILNNWKKSEHYFGRDGYDEGVFHYSRICNSTSPIVLEKKTEDVVIEKFKRVKDFADFDFVNVSVKNDYKICFSSNGLVSDLKIAHAKARFRKEYDYSTKEYFDKFDNSLQASKIWGGEQSFEDNIAVNELVKLNIDVRQDKDFINWIKKKKNWFKRENIPFEQFVKEDDDSNWVELHKDCGVKNLDPIFHEYVCKAERLKQSHLWINDLYFFQVEDGCRLATKKSCIDATQQGLGKTRKAIFVSLLRGCKHTLIIVPSHLLKEWSNEFSNLKEDFHVINCEKDVKRLKKFNLVSYNTLKKDYKRVGCDKQLIFADKLKKKFKEVIVDEAHYLSNSTTSQTKAVSKLKPKHWLLLSGTPIGNTVKNVYSLLHLLHKKGSLTDTKKYSPLFPYSTKSFRENFVTVDWVTPEFDDTLSSGRTAQQMADVKNPEKFIALMQSKWLRRTKDEPRVEDDISIPKPVFFDVEITPCVNHMKFYKEHLEKFAELFKKMMEDKKLGSHQNSDKVSHSMVLAQLGNLQFVSTMPQHPKVNIDDIPYSYDCNTQKQEETLKLVKELVCNKEKVIVFTLRPDFCDYMKKELDKHNISSFVFTGKQTIEVRNKSLDAFKFGKTNVLLASINVTDTGLNIPQANSAIMVDPDWKYSKLEQAFSRILRPQSTGKPKVYFLRNKGMIDEYMHQHCMRKKGANGEVLDKKNWEKAEWEHWKDMTIRMLKDAGLWD